MHLKALAAATAILMFAAGAACADVITFSAALKGSSEVPPNDSKGTGEVKATLDTDTHAFTYTATYSGLSGPGIAAHFHGPATPGADAGVQVPVPAANVASPINGTATLTDAQIDQLKDGKWYFNVHTKAIPGGEIRGQLQRQ
jgi:hypothetical protein